MLTKNKREIKNFIEKRGIVALTHFTHIRNLDSILNNGLLSKDFLEKEKMDYKYNDELRLEGKTNAICLSISYPNYKMFFKYRCQEEGEWCILSLHPSILYEKDCLFCIGNAASSSERQRSDSLKSNISGLKKLFHDPDFYRDSVELPDRYPTNPQAEVLVLDSIEPKYIKAIYFDRRHKEALRFISNYPNFKFNITYKAFLPRYDHKNW